MVTLPILLEVNKEVGKVKLAVLVNAKTADELLASIVPDVLATVVVPPNVKVCAPTVKVPAVKVTPPLMVELSCNAQEPPVPLNTTGPKKDSPFEVIE